VCLWVLLQGGQEMQCFALTCNGLHDRHDAYQGITAGDVVLRVVCRALLQWAESPGGKAQIAVELKALRSQASARLVRDMLATSEGKEGLIRGLQAVLASDNTLATQLRALVGGGNGSSGR
jgi:hypothetical protein